jgi:hypothetical protein
MSTVRYLTDFDKSDADPRLLAVLGLGIAVFLLAMPLVLLIAYPEAARSGALPPNLPQPPAPRLQTNPKEDLDRLRSYERKQLEGSGWTDRSPGLAHIPIDRAMQLLVDRGLPGWPAAKAATASRKAVSR